jgi:hypothetical protein
MAAWQRPWQRWVIRVIPAHGPDVALTPIYVTRDEARRIAANIAKLPSRRAGAVI